MKSSYQGKYEALCDQDTCLQNFGRLTKPEAFKTQVLELRRTLSRCSFAVRLCTHAAACWHRVRQVAQVPTYWVVVFTDR